MAGAGAGDTPLFDIKGITTGGFGKFVSGFFGSGSVAEQFLIWGVLQQIAGAVLAPVVAEIQQGVFALAPDLVNQPEVLAAMVARSLLSDDSGKNNAAKNGIGGEAFEELVKAAGHAPDFGAVLELFRRGLIDQGGSDGTSISFDGALLDAGLRSPWIELLSELKVQIPSIAEVMNAWLEGQIDEGEAQRRYILAGGDPTWFQTSYNANGQAPTPVQALELWNRGIISESGTGPDSTSYEQAFLEGPWRNKWLAAFKALREYLPPPRTVTAMVHSGQMTKAQGLQYLQWQGLTAELSAMYLSDATHAKLATAKELTKTDISDLYIAGALDAATATKFIETLGFDATEAGYLLKLWDIRKQSSTINNAVSRVRSQYNAGTIDQAAAHNALIALGVAAADAASMLAAWQITKSANQPRLSASEIASALQYAVIDQPTAQNRLEAMGYAAHDAWIILSTRAHGPLPGEPESS